ncbi:MAG: hypothetical protein E7515_08435 [Ruminococcaceae bacterium]|nr:hypothetical protein [Oscillospiraceae bacterium]
MKSSLNRSAKSNLLFTCVVALCVLAIVAFPFIANLYVNRGVTPSVDAEVTSFKGVNMDSGREYHLKGDWEFFPKQFIVTGKASNPAVSSIVSVPHSIYYSLHNEPSLYDYGYASYRLVVRDISAQQPVCFYIPNFSGAYKIFIDKILVTTSGTVSKGSDDTVSSQRRMALPVSVSDGIHEIVIEASSDKSSGLTMSPVIRNYNRAENGQYLSVGFRYAFVGIVLFCGIFLLIMKLFASQESYSLWGVALCTFLAYRMMISNEGYIVTQALFFGLSYEYVSLLIIAATFIIKLVSLIYITRVLPVKVSPAAVISFAVMFITAILTALFFERSFYDPYYATILHIVSLTLDLYLIEKICRCVMNKTRNAIAFLVAYSLVTVGLSVDFLYTNGLIQTPVSMFMPLTLLAFAIIIVLVHAMENALLQKEALNAAKLETELADANMSIMLSQIQPHFLYNALNTIKYLVRRDTEMAEKAIVEFSLYLRGNMDSLTQKKPIPFRTELSHIRHYCEIEKMRFGKKLEIEYDIETDDFYVPTLSIQPLVENSIKHGVTKKPEGGTVTIHTYQDENNFYVNITDDGVGFDPNRPLSSERSHVGFKNIKNRLETMLGAKIEVSSVVNEGTNTLVTLPKKSNFGENDNMINY